MENNHTINPRNLLNRLSKDTAQPTQLQTIFHYLLDHIATASMVSFETGVPRKSICRYKRELEQVGLLREIVKSNCEITGHKAWFLTTDPGQAPI
jgi:hypothetical protein